jgi:hypothetical protein
MATIIPGFKMIKNKCNMDPTSFSMPVIDLVPWLGCHFNLNMMELHSCQIAHQVLPHTCVFFGIAAEMLLQLPPSRIPQRHQEGHGFGCLLANVMSFKSSRMWRRLVKLSPAISSVAKRQLSFQVSK